MSSSSCNLTQTNLAFTPHSKPSIPSSLLRALTASKSLIHLKQVHGQILRSKLDRPNVLLFKVVLSSCALSSSLDYALSVFNQMDKTDTHLCNKILRELSRGAKPEKALVVYAKMRKDGLSLVRFSFPPLLKAVSKLSGLREGLEIHGLASRMGFDSDPFIQTGLMGMYASSGRIAEARLLFDKMSYRDIVAWNSMIDGYSQSGLLEDVLKLFEEMKISCIKPDEMILCSIVSACGRAGNLSHGRVLHEFIMKNSITIDCHLQSALINMYVNCCSMDYAEQLFDQIPTKNLVVSTAMITGYAKLKRVEDARLIFDQMYEKDLVCWSAMISGYAESDTPEEALKLFNEMQQQGILPDHITMLSVISACAHLGAVDQAKSIHMYVDRNGFGKALRINNALIDMYSKCGNLGGARSVFNHMPIKDVVTWSCMINGFAMNGNVDDALRYFHNMKRENIEPNGVTFVCVLYACSHAGLVAEAKQIFSSMNDEYGISPKYEHYGCMVDLYCRANLLREALDLIETMPLTPNAVIWGSLMSACQVRGEVDLGKYAAKRLLELEPDHDGALVVLSNFYAREKRWNDVEEVRNLMSQKGISKERGCSRIELNNKVHEFLMADGHHEQADQIYQKLDEIVRQLKLVGYVPNSSVVLVNIDEEEKKEVVLWHSEKLALSFGLVSASQESCIRIIKNLRICEDCHTFMKLVSKVYQKEIIVRDRTRFHHFRDGICSCKDYW